MSEDTWAEEPEWLADERLEWLKHWDADDGLVHANGHPPADPASLSVFVDWDALWKRDRSEADYLLDEVIVRGRGHTIYAQHKAGKSLFTLWACTQIIAHQADTVVIYLDYEMTEDDLQERLEDMGIGPDTDLSRLRYWLLPTLPPLNTAHGADALLDIVRAVSTEHPEHHIAVIIDTTSRAVSGEENDSGPYRDFYRLTGLRLKQLGVTWVRLDHEGKDPTKEQRGSSAKGDDIDIAWRITATDDGIALNRKLSRLSWVPEKVTYAIGEAPLRYLRTGRGYLAGTGEVARELDRLGVPADVTVGAAQAALREAGTPRRRNVVGDALRWRREHACDPSDDEF